MTKIKVEKTQVLVGHRDSIYTLVPTHEPSQVVSAAGDGMIVLWDLSKSNDGQLLAKVTNSVYAIALSKHANQLIIGHNYEGIHLIDLETKKQISSRKLTSASIFDIQVTKDYIFVAMGNGEVAVLNEQTLEVVRQLTFSTQSARSITINPTKKEIAIGYSDHIVRIISLETWEIIYELKEHINSVFSVNYSPNGQFLLTTSRDATLKIWNVEEQYNLHKSIVAHMYTINHLTYSPNQQYFATCSKDKSIKIWDATSFKLLKVIDKARHAGHGTSINKLYWSSHKNQLISCSDDRTISTWNIEFN